MCDTFASLYLIVILSERKQGGDPEEDKDLLKEGPIEALKRSKGFFLVTDKRVFNGPLGRSLRSFARTAQSAHSLRSATLR